MLNHLLAAIATGALLLVAVPTPANAETGADAEYPVLCVQHTAPGGTATPKICVPLLVGRQ